MTYHIGDKVRCTGTIAQTNGTNIDPTTVRAWYRMPGSAGIVTTLIYGTDAALVKSATGIYYMDVDVDTQGTYYYGFYSTGTGKAASSDGVLRVVGSKRVA